MTNKLIRHLNSTTIFILLVLCHQLNHVDGWYGNGWVIQRAVGQCYMLVRSHTHAMFYTAAPFTDTNIILAICIGLIAMMAGLFTGQYLADRGDFDAVEIRATLDPHMSEESLSLLAQAKIAECTAGESRQMLAAWTLDMRSASGYASDEYVAGMDFLIEAVSDSAEATEAWAAAAKWAAADGAITAAEHETLAKAESYMADVNAGAYDALMSTPAGQLGAMIMPGMTEAYMQAAVLTGSETECW